MIRTTELPAGWSWSSLEEIALSAKNAIVDGPFGSNLKTSDYIDDGIPVLQGKNITRNRFKWFDVRYISETKATELARSRVDVGDILIIKIGSIGYSAELTDLNGYPYAIIPANMAKLTIDPDKVNKKYILHWLSSSDVKRHFQGVASKTAQPALSLGKIKSLPIPLPPLVEQKRIAAILDKADAIRQKRKQAIELADEFLRSVFWDMFGDPVTNPKGWEIKTISDFCNVSSGSTPSRKREDYFQGSIPWVKTTEVDGYVIKDTEEKITELAVKETSCKLNPIGAIVVAMYGQGKTRGKVGILGVEAATNQACAVLAPSNSINMSYLYYYLKFSYETLRSLGQGGGQPNLNGTIVKQFPIMHPPKHLQDRFVDIVTVYESATLKNKTVASSCIEIFNSLSQKAFSGQL